MTSGDEAPPSASSSSEIAAAPPTSAMLEQLAPGQRWLASPVEGELDVFVEHGVRPTSSGEQMHRGIDVRAKSGAFVLAVAAGRVEHVDAHPLEGVRVQVRHDDGTETVYAGLAQPSVVPRASVDQGAALGIVGHAHPMAMSSLHFEVLAGGAPADPLDFLGAAR